MVGNATTPAAMWEQAEKDFQTNKSGDYSNILWVRVAKYFSGKPIIPKIIGDY